MTELDLISEEIQAVKECEEMLDDIAKQIEVARPQTLIIHRLISAKVRLSLEATADEYTPALFEKLDKIDAIIERRLNEESI